MSRPPSGRRAGLAIGLVGAIFLITGLGVSSAPAAESPAPRLNLLLITVDTLRADRLSCYDESHVQTPAIDGLARRGTLFAKAFAHVPLTLPSHASLLLGMTPLSHGVHDNLNFVVIDEFTTLAEYLRDQGYRTAAFVGAYPLDSRFGLDQGFEVYDDQYQRKYNLKPSTLERRAEEVVTRAVEYLERAASPWFVWVHCYDPHFPYDPPEPYRGRFAANPYDGEVAYVDAMLGRLVGRLEASGRYEDTVIVLTGDHGEALGDHGEENHGYFAYNECLRIPLIIVTPGGEQRRVTEPVSHIDVFPTVCDLLGLERPPFLRGRSLRETPRGRGPAPMPIYFECLDPYYSKGWAPIRGFISEDEKYIDSPIPELYDLRTDFGETANLASSREVGAYRARLEKIVRDQSTVASGGARRAPDKEILEKLKSLGYLSGPGASGKETFSAADDVKTLLPLLTRTQQATALYGQGRKDEAVAILREIIRQRKDFSPAYVSLGSLLADDRKAPEAVSVMEEGLANLPYSYDIYSHAIKFMSQVGRADDVLRLFKPDAFREMDYDSGIWILAGLAHFQKKQVDSAVTVLEKALSIDARDPQAHFFLGEALEMKALEDKDPGLLSKATEAYQRSLEYDPGYPAPYFYLGRLYKLAGKPYEAIFCWKKAVELNPAFEQPAYALGVTYLELKDGKNALVYLNSIKRRFYPAYPPARKREIDALIDQAMALPIR
jgi:arylsulfatase A-like enzyme/tetratricopeptide (TPR) repeat protein